ncbi:MAG: hypothetical protein WC943_17505, partial [Elusimicrobiota bacterium]
TEQSVAGMKGDLAALSASFATLGPAALAVAGIGLAWEALREAMAFIPEAIDHTNELAESYSQLKITAGMTEQDFNGFSAAIQMTGGKTSDLHSIVGGMQKAIKANADTLVDNGIAANKAALSHMTLGEYIAAVTHKMETYGEATDRDQLLMAAFGRSGVAFADTLEKLNGHMAEGIKYGIENEVVTLAATKAEDELKRVKGLLAAANDTLKASVAGVTAEYAIQMEQVKLGTMQWVNDMTMAQRLAKDGKIAMQTEMVWDSQGQQVEIENWEAMIAAGKEYLHTQAALASQAKTNEQGERTGKFKPAGENKAAAEERRAMRKAVDEDIIRSAAHVVAEQMKDDRELVASGQMTYAELTADMKNAYKIQLDTAMKALKDEEKLAAGKPAELQAILNKEKELTQKYHADIRELERQAAENTRKEQARAAAETEKARKQNLELVKLAVQDEINLQRSIIEAKEQALDQDLAFGRINEAQWVAMKRAGIAQELKAQLDALNTEQKAAKDDLVTWTKIENQKLALTRKSHADMGKLDADLVNKSKARWDGFFGSMTGGWNGAIQGLVKGTMTWGDALNEVTSQALSGLISFFVQWGEQEAIRWATGLAMGETGRVAEATGAAAVYAVNAMGSVAAIPFYGWSMAPEVGAAAYSQGLSMAGLASAAGGWERVPSDQVAQLHKNEQVLPAHYAEGLRNLVANEQSGGRKGGGPLAVHFNGVVDAKSFFHQNQGNIIRTLRKAAGNRRFRIE